MLWLTNRLIKFSLTSAFNETNENVRTGFDSSEHKYLENILC